MSGAASTQHHEAHGHLFAACPTCGAPPGKLAQEGGITGALAECSADGCKGYCYALCSRRCGEGKPEGIHFYHAGPCAWHDGTCEETSANPSLWCPCGKEAR